MRFGSPGRAHRSPPQQPDASAAEQTPHSPQASSRRRRRDVDSGDEGEAGTPTSARFAQTVATGLGAATHPPLAEDAGVSALTERLQDIVDPQYLPATAKNFKPESFVTALKMNLRQHDLELEHDHSSAGASTQAPQIVVRPAFDHVVFFRSPAEAEADKAWSVPNKALATKMVQRGYKRLNVTHLPADERELPSAVGSGPVRGPPGALESDPYPPPLELRVPRTCPEVDKAASAPTPAAQLVEWFEVKVKMHEHGRTVVYSPMKEWTNAARREAKFDRNQSTPFTVRCKLYLYIRRFLSAQETEPADFRLSWDALRTAAQNSLKKYSAVAANEKQERGEALEEGAVVGDWYSAAVEESKNYV